MLFDRPHDYQPDVLPARSSDEGSAYFEAPVDELLYLRFRQIQTEVAQVNTQLIRITQYDKAELEAVTDKERESLQLEKPVISYQFKSSDRRSSFGVDIPGEGYVYDDDEPHWVMVVSETDTSHENADNFISTAFIAETNSVSGDMVVRIISPLTDRLSKQMKQANSNDMSSDKEAANHSHGAELTMEYAAQVTGEALDTLRTLQVIDLNLSSEKIQSAKEQAVGERAVEHALVTQADPEHTDHIQFN